jgi:alkylation response protein AidB-like acyl-CoA dehydrogenase
MDLAFGEQHDLLRDSTRRFLDDCQPLSAVRARMENGEPFDAAVWQQGAELGWTAMLIPANRDGGSVTDQPVVDLIVLAEELGRTLHPGPIVPTNVVADLMVRYGNDAMAKEWLPPIARGEVTAAWCMTGDGSADQASIEVVATPAGDGWALHGSSRYVEGARNAGVLLVAAHQGDGLLHFAVPAGASGLSIRTLASLDLTRRLHEVCFDNVVVPASGVLTQGPDAWERGLAVATVLQAGMSVGAADHVFGATVDYLKARQQFGRTIASFQAIKHRIADLLISLEAMRSAVYYAALALAETLTDAPEAVATVGAFVDDAFADLCGEAVQLHGGIGFTWEHDLHLFLRRAKSSQVLYGDGAWHRERLCTLLEQSAPRLGG